MKTILFILGLILTAVFFYSCIHRHGSEIETDVYTRVMAAFKVADLPGAGEVHIDGRDITLKGMVESDEIKGQVGDVARRVAGVHVVHNQIDVMPPAPEETSLAQPDNVPVVVSAPPQEEVQDLATEPEPVVDACQEKLKALLEEEKVLFSSGQSAIDATSYGLLNKIVEEAKQCEDSLVHVHGHTDSSGNADTNRMLSLERARSVGKYLRNNGVSQEIRAFGHGANQPLVSNDTPEGRAQNRRLEFKVYKKPN